jgi:L-2,4-diaminobutyrate decarboxylase
VFDADFLSPNNPWQAAYLDAIHRAARLLTDALPNRPYSGATPAELAKLFADGPCGDNPVALADALASLRPVVENSVAVWHPFTAAHLHCPPLVAGLAAEVVLSGLNQSMDSFDQAPAATMLELRLVHWLCQEAGFPATADGTMTPGGTVSNYTALLLARDGWCRTHLNWPTMEKGLPPEAGRFRILCSELAHFSVAKSAAQLGLGTAAVVPVAVDVNFRMCLGDLDRQLARLSDEKLIPIAIVATAGTTDFGSIDPLAQVAAAGRRVGAWVHVDAAYGGALLFSPKQRGRLAGLADVDSVTLDFHKLFWQPISGSALLVRDAARFDPIKLNADYLNPEEHEALGIPDLVTRSVLTTRRFDALKVWLSFRTLGRRKFAAMIDRTMELATAAAVAVRADKRLELLSEPEIGCVLFRYLPAKAATVDEVNHAIRRRLFDTGRAVIGHTKFRGVGYLKLTMLNPCTRPAAAAELVHLIAAEGAAIEREMTAGAESTS